VNAVSPNDIFASYNEATAQTPCALSKSTYDVAEHAFSVPLDPLANYPTYHSSQIEPDGGNDGYIKDDVDVSWKASRAPSTSRDQSLGPVAAGLRQQVDRDPAGLPQGLPGQPEGR
jgi:hypothetical protein